MIRGTALSFESCVKDLCMSITTVDLFMGLGYGLKIMTESD